MRASIFFEKPITPVREPAQISILRIFFCISNTTEYLLKIICILMRFSSFRLSFLSKVIIVLI